MNRTVVPPSRRRHSTAPAVLACLLLLAAAPPAVASGELDPAFGDGGTLALPLASGSNADEAFGLAVQDDGRIVAAGYFAAPAQKFVAVRLDEGGDPDPGFGVAGVVQVAIGTRGRAQAVALRGDGKVILAGYGVIGGRENFALVRLLEDGTPDPDFGPSGDGIVTTAVGTRDNRAQAVVLQSDGKILAGGWARNSSNRDLALVRYDEDGVPDPDFGDAGHIMLPIGTGNDEVMAILLQSDGKIVVAGYAADGGQQDMLVARLLDDGALDTSFNATGFNRITFGDGTEVGRALAIRPNGSVRVAGHAAVGGKNLFAVARVDDAGVLDASFDGDGRATTAIGDLAEARAMVSLARNRFLLAGRARVQGSKVDFAAARYQGNGKIDSTFGTNGVVTFPVGTKNDEVWAAAAYGAEAIVLAGTTRTGANASFGLARLLTDNCGDGFLDPDEQCDPGADEATCCSTTCSRLPADAVCRAASGTCDVAEVCDGASADCPADVVLGAGTSCRGVAGDCDVAEACDGVSPACPADARVAAGTACRDSGQACDAVESCDGSSAQCPTDLLAPAGTACREVADGCDLAEACDGAGAACPADERLPDGDGDAVCDALDVCPLQSDPAQADADADGRGDACDACTGGVSLRKALVKFRGGLTPPGDDAFKLLGEATFASNPVVNPTVDGVRVILQASDGSVLFDVTVPGGAFDANTGTGWKTMGRVQIFKTPTPLAGFVRKVKVSRTITPGRWAVKVSGLELDLSSLPALDGVDATVLVTPGAAGVCAQVALLPPNRGCAPNEDGSAVVCR